MVHEDVEDPGFAILDAAPVHRDLVVGRQTVINFLKRGEAAPGLQLGHIFDFSVSLKHHQIVLRDYQVDVYHLLSHLSCLFALLGKLELDFLLAWENSTFGVLKPNEHIIVQPQMKSAQLSYLVLLRLLVS